MAARAAKPPWLHLCNTLPGEAWALRASNSDTYYIIYKLFTHAIVVQTAENKLTFKNKYDIIILLYGAYPHTRQAVGEGNILWDGKQPKNDLETTKAFSPQTTPIPILRKRKKKILIRAAWRGDPRREKASSFPGKDEAPEPSPSRGGKGTSCQWVANLVPPVGGNGSKNPASSRSRAIA